MNSDQIDGTLSFLRSAESLKDVLRSSHTSTGRAESTAEHSWRLCLWAIVFKHAVDDLDMVKLLKICVIHDLGEAISGDIPAPEQTGDDKSSLERRDMAKLLEPLPTEARLEFMTLWDEYEQGTSPEGLMVKGFDKLETIMQHNQGKNPAAFDYGFNLTYGADKMQVHPLLGEIRQILDAETRAHVEEK